ARSRARVVVAVVRGAGRAGCGGARRGDPALPPRPGPERACRAGARHPTGDGGHAVTFGGQEVSVRFGNVCALTGVSLTVPAGAVTAVVGGDGGGKSTLLRCLVGQVAADRGGVDRPAKREIGYLPSSSGTWRDLTVNENLAFVAG